MQNYRSAQDILKQVLAYYTQPASRSLAAAAAVAETLGMAFMMALEWKAAAAALEQSLAMHAQLLAEQPGRLGAVAEAAKPHFLLSVVYCELGDLEKVCGCQTGSLPSA
jgi:hypothetical protein